MDYYDTADYWIRSIRTPAAMRSDAGRVLHFGVEAKSAVPADFAAELLPYDLASQEFRVHYAGFFDPGFGYGLHGEIPGTRAVLEVRASQMPILLEDDQFVGRLNYFHMAATPDKVYGGRIGSSYQQQGLALSKQFKREQQILSSPGAAMDAGAKEGEMQPAGMWGWIESGRTR